MYKKVFISVFMLILVLQQGIAEDYFFPHFTQKEGEWHTQITLNNPQSTSVELLVSAFSNTGELVGEHNLVLPPRGHFLGSVDSLVPTLSSDTGWLTISCNMDQLVGHLTFENKFNGGITSLPLTKTLAAGLSYPFIQNEEDYQSGFVVLNPTELPSSILVRLINLENHSDWMEETIQLDKGQKWVGMVEDLFLDEPYQKARLEVIGNRDLTGFALTFKNYSQQIIAVPATPVNSVNWYEFQQAHNQLFVEMFGQFGNVSGFSTQGGDTLISGTGYSNVTQKSQMLPETISDIGSLTKLFVSVLALKVQEQGLFDLDETIDNWLPELPHSNAITLRMLLNHTSGIAGYDTAPGFLDELMTQYLQSNDVFTPTELIEYGINVGPLFEPGQGYAYSNTNYILMGLIIEQVTQSSLEVELNQQILIPLKLEHTFMQYYGNQSHDTHVYVKLDGSGFQDVTEARNLSWLWAAGGIASSIEDLIEFYHAIFSNGFIKSESLAELLDVPIINGQPTQYGLGINVNMVDGELILSHAGTTLSSSAFMIYFPDSATTFVSMFNFRDLTDPLELQNKGLFAQTLVELNR